MTVLYHTKVPYSALEFRKWHRGVGVRMHIGEPLRTLHLLLELLYISEIPHITPLPHHMFQPGIPFLQNLIISPPVNMFT